MQELDALLNDLNDAGYAAVYRPASNGAPTVAPPSEFSGGKSRTGGGVPHRDQTVALARMDQPDNVIGHGVGDGGRGDDSLHSYETRTVTVTESVPDGYKAAVSATEELDQLMSSLSDFKIHSTSRHHTVIEESEPVYARPLRSADQLDSMLGKLRNDMDKQGVDTLTDKGTCAGCDKPIAGQVITALDKSWHPEHFTCAHCRQELANKSFFERDGLPYCETDYHNLFSPRCAYCNGPILDKCVTALQQTWHPEHFFCAHCGEPFGDGGFHERDGRPYCQRDYFQLFAAKCGGCQQPIMENYITALGGQWHPHCFVCKDCKRSFESGSFFDHEGQPYCETHYHAKRGSLCAGCNKPITGRCITAMFRKFHPEHFVCTFCLKQLNKGTFKEQTDKPYCHTCFDKLFG